MRPALSSWVLSISSLLTALSGACAPRGPTLSPAALNVSVQAPRPVGGGEGSAERGADLRAQHIRANYTKYEHRIPMRDGARLFTTAYVPNDASADKRYPILMVRTPYGAGPYGLDRYRKRLGPEPTYETEGFIFVFQDVRGAHMSEGEFVNMRPLLEERADPKAVDESTDAYDTVAWLLEHVRHHNGRVGQWGISYPGFYTAAAAVDSHPALVAVSPQAPIADWFRGDDMHRHGAFNLQLAFSFFSAFGRPRPEPIPDEEWKGFHFDTPDAYRFYLDMGPVSAIEQALLKGTIPFWTDLASHPNYDAFWRARNLLPHLVRVRPAVLVVGGWYDTEDLYGPLQIYRAIERSSPNTENTLVMGPWWHGGWHRSDGRALGDADFGFATSERFHPIELSFFRRHLKQTDEPRQPEAFVFETGANRFRAFERWPPPDTREATLYLRDHRRLSFEQGSERPDFDEYLSDPAHPVPYTQELSQDWGTNYMAEDQRFASRRPDVLSYQTEPLPDDVTLAGPLEAELYVSTTGTDADYVVKLIDVNPGKIPGYDEEAARRGEKNRGGQETLVRGEPFRARFRDSYEQPKPMSKGETTKIRFEINDIFHTFQRGHRIMVQVQSSWFPFIDRNPQTFVPNIFEAKAEDFVTATQRIHRGKDTPSGLHVRVLARDE